MLYGRWKTLMSGKRKHKKSVDRRKRLKVTYLVPGRRKTMEVTRRKENTVFPEMLSDFDIPFFFNFTCSMKLLSTTYRTASLSSY
jgi:hypothetical protein